ncbi:TPA: hypothetical protein ACYEOW_003648 [Raoultella terrigena]
MPITTEEIKEHMDKYGTHSIDAMNTADYKHLLAEEAFFWSDPHGCVMHQLSGERIVTNTEQLDALIDHLESYRRLLPHKIKRVSNR